MIDLFLRACAQGKLDGVRKLAAIDPALVNATGPHPFWGGNPQPLQVAAEWGRFEVVQFLLGAGADLECADSDYGGWKPLHCAIHRSHGQIVQLLVAKGADIDAWAAASLGDETRLAGLLQANADLASSLGPNKATPLHFAATATVADLLLSKGSSLEALDCYRRTPLENMACYGSRRAEAARSILNQQETSDLPVLCALGELDKVRKHLAAVNQPNARGVFPLQAASQHGQLLVARLLLESKASVNQTDERAVTPLHLASGNGHLEIVKLLLSHGADLTLKDKQHEATSLAWAQFQEQTEVSEYLSGLLASL